MFGTSQWDRMFKQKLVCWRILWRWKQHSWSAFMTEEIAALVGHTTGTCTAMTAAAYPNLKNVWKLSYSFDWSLWTIYTMPIFNPKTRIATFSLLTYIFFCIIFNMKLDKFLQSRVIYNAHFWFFTVHVGCIKKTKATLLYQTCNFAFIESYVIPSGATFVKKKWTQEKNCLSTRKHFFRASKLYSVFANKG